jgi:CBS domain-containing protein
MSLANLADIFSIYNFDGVPVIDKEGILRGIITEYDLISKESLLHLPTLKRVMESLNISKEDKPHFEEEVLSKLNIKAEDIMNNDPLTLSPDTSYEEVIKTFQDHHRVNPIPVVDENKKVLGIISRFDVLKPLHVLASEVNSK